MSMFQRRKGKSLYNLYNKSGITRLLFFMKNNVQDRRYLYAERFAPVVDNSNLPIVHVGGRELENNKMYGIFGLTE